MNIYIRDDLPPESLAMLQALYSRSPASVVEHIKKVEAVGADRFMKNYYVGYGHRSIGDCGSTTLFVEGVSMLAAKAIQDWPLYRGQEASTRYMDFSTVKIEDPVGTLGSREIQDAWMTFYHAAQDAVRQHLMEKYPRQPDEKEDVYERAINARKFDVLRAFLPAGATTNLSWHVDLRQADDHLKWLTEHPDPTIRQLSYQIQDALDEKYPSSFIEPEEPDEKKRLAREQANEAARAWRGQMADRYTYFDDDIHLAHDPKPRPVSVMTQIHDYHLHEVADLLASRPRRAELPPWMSKYGTLRSSFLLDFGSFRDLQRHRNGVVRMPLLTTRWGFHAWYLSELPEALVKEAKRLVEVQKTRLRALDLSGVPKVVQQYYCAMGFMVACEVTQPLPAWVYRVELRTSPSVHPTLRSVTQEEARQFKERFPKIALHADMSPDTWDTRRGKQTIIEKA